VIDESLLGGWLEYSSPRLNPVIDGLLDSYSVAWGDQVAGMFRLDPGWEHFVAHTGARVAVLYATSRLVPALEEVLGWREVAQDHGWVYLVAPQSGPGG
jgi:hypothetical protein